jgi:hypothetical protein
MSQLEDFEDVQEVQLPGQTPMRARGQPGWARAMAWATVALGGLYIINPTLGIFELIPDALPIVGNLDEAAVMFLIFGAMRYLGMRLPDFVERWAQPLPQLPSGVAPKQE